MKPIRSGPDVDALDDDRAVRDDTCRDHPERGLGRVAGDVEVERVGAGRPAAGPAGRSPTARRRSRRRPRPASPRCGRGWRPARARRSPRSASSPANRIADFTWALAMGGVHSMPWRPAPGHHQRRQLGRTAPMHGRPHGRERFGDAVHRAGRERGVARRAWWSRAGSPRPRPTAGWRCPSCRSRSTRPRAAGPGRPRSRTAPSSALERRRRGRPPRRRSARRRRRRRARARSLVPSASAPMRRARCEIDLSPGVRTVPVRCRPPAMATVSARPGPVMTVGSRCTSGRARRWPRAARSASSAPTTRVSTPRGPSAEWAMSRS